MIIEKIIKKLNKKLVFILAVIVLLTVSASIYLKNKALGVDVVMMDRGTVEKTITVSGNIKSEEEISLSFPTGGVIKEINAKEGETVSKGDLLAKADSVSEYNTYLSARAAYEQAQATLDQFIEQYKDDPDSILIGSDDVYWKKYRTLEEAVKGARGKMNATLNTLSNKNIHSPIDGVVVRVNYERGEYAPLGSEVVAVIDPKRIYFEGEVDEEDFGLLEEGQKAVITLDSFEKERHEGKLLPLPKVTSTDSTGSIVFNVKISLGEDLAKKAISGMNGDAEITVSSKENAQRIDIDSIWGSKDNPYVFVLKNGKAKKTYIKTGLEGDVKVEVLEGLDSGDLVITTRDKALKDGWKVKVNE